MNPFNIPQGALLLLAAACAFQAQAGVTPAEAAELKDRLTPLGAERAGNKDGSIPAWSGGMTTPIPGQEPGGRRLDPFANEKPLFAITAKNADQHAGKLSEGTIALLKKYPDTYRLDVYPTHRTAAAPQWVYDNTLRNATQASLTDGSAGPMPKNAFGGIPFPIPKTGAEAMWNHMLRWRGESTLQTQKGYQLNGRGNWINVVAATNDMTMPYYYKESNAEQFAADGSYWQVRSINSGPPIRAGEALVGMINVDDTKSQNWIYLTGQRRTRKVPNACCDTPTPFSAGIITFDEVNTFNGRLERFDWTLVGKQEMYIPYNTNRTVAAPSDAAVLGAFHLNPDHVRWELHRVWVVEAKLKAGQRHVSPKSRYYLDEDTYLAVLADRWDAQGQLARVAYSLPIAMPDVPATAAAGWGVYDLIGSSVFVNDMFADQKRNVMAQVPRPPARIFSPEALSGASVR